MDQAVVVWIAVGVKLTALGPRCSCLFRSWCFFPWRNLIDPQIVWGTSFVQLIVYISWAFKRKLCEGVTLLSVPSVASDVLSRGQEIILLLAMEVPLAIRPKRELSQPYWIVKLIYHSKWSPTSYKNIDIIYILSQSSENNLMNLWWVIQMINQRKELFKKICTNILKTSFRSLFKQ